MAKEMTEYVLKHGQKHDRELKYDFMPSLLEIIERPAHKAGTVIILGVFSLLIAAVVWACLSEIDVVITASGTVQPVGNVSSLNSYASGTIKAINVEEGAYVKAGDILIELDTQSIDIDVESISSQKEILEAQKEIYTMIKNGEDVSAVDVTKYSANLQPYILTIIDNDKAYQNNLSLLESAKENAGLTRDIAQIKWDDYSEQINSSISDINSKLKQAETELEKYQLSLEYQKITAPVNGYINSLVVNNIGEAVTSAQQIATIVPADTPVEMVCYVKNMDIADIEIGMESEIKLEAYPYNKFGTVDAAVKYISPSSFNSEQLGNVYLVKLDIDNDNPDINIMSGLSGSVEIKTDKRTVMDYFLEPILKGFDESLKEK